MPLDMTIILLCLFVTLITDFVSNIATDNTTVLREDPIRNKSILDRFPQGRWGTPQDLMGIIVFLCQEALNYLNGTVVTVDNAVGWDGNVSRINYKNLWQADID